MLSKIIKVIRSKPEPVRKGITLGLSLGITSIFAFFWFISFINYSNKVLSSKPSSDLETPTSFLQRISGVIGGSYANIRSQFDGEKSIFVTGTTSDSMVTDTNVNSSGGNNGGLNNLDNSVDINKLEENNETNKVQASSTSTGSLTTEGIAPSSVINSSLGSVNNDKINTGTSLDDILNTKKQDNQVKKATTSSKVLVQ